MTRALFVSPHLDDAAFSCAETMLALRLAGWEVTLATVFTASVADPRGFALECQLDKGLTADVDYMRLRRAEDTVFADALNITIRHLDLAEAPHRGYKNAAALFDGVADNDPARTKVPAALADLIDAVRPDLCFGPIGIGGHVDHALVVAGLTQVLASRQAPPLYRWPDQPYASKHRKQAADAITALPVARSVVMGSRAERREQALAAVEAYATQLDFQFGSARAMHDTLARVSAAGIPLYGAAPWPSALTCLTTTD